MSNLVNLNTVKKNFFLKTLFSNFTLMSIISKMLQCAVCYSWMAHLALIVVYIEFAWNYVRFNSNDNYFMRFTHLQKSPNYTNKSLNYFTVGDSWIPVWSGDRFGKSTHISMINNSVTHLRSYTNSAIADIAENSAPISPVTPRDRWSLRIERQYRRIEWRVFHDVSQCFKSDSWCFTSGSRCFTMYHNVLHVFHYVLLCLTMFYDV